MAKTLIDRIKTGIETGAFCLSLIGCGNYCNEAPIGNAILSNQYAKRGENVEFKLNATDDGIITRYEVRVDENGDNIPEQVISQSEPIQMSYTANVTGKTTFDWTCYDDDGLSTSGTNELTVSDSNLPTVDLTGVNSTVIEGRTQTIYLPAPIDDDTNGTINYTNAISLTDGVTVSLNDNNLEVSSDAISQEKDYSVALTFGSETGGINTATLEGKVKNLCNISGQLQDIGTDLNKAGYVKMFNNSTNEFLGSTYTADGNFTVQATSPTEEVRLEGAVYSGGWKSFIRTNVQNGTEDHNDIILRCVPKITFDANGDGSINGSDNGAFKESFGKTNTESTCPGLKKNEITNYEVLLTDPRGRGSFNSAQQLAMKNKLEDTTNCGIFAGRSLVGSVQVDTAYPPVNPHYQVIGSYIIADEGWCVIAPNSLIAGGDTYIFYRNNNPNLGIIGRVTIEINPGATGEANPYFAHEIGHALIAPIGHATMNNAVTIMNATGITLLKPGVADQIQADIINDETIPPKTRLNDILGQTFSDGASVY